MYFPGSFGGGQVWGETHSNYTIKSLSEVVSLSTEIKQMSVKVAACQGGTEDCNIAFLYC